MSRAALAIACAALAAPLLSCAATSGSGDPGPKTVVKFSYDAVRPETVHITPDGIVTWVNTAPDSRGVVLFPATITSGFTCGEDLRPYFKKTAAGYESLPITSFESNTVQLPCPLEPGTYDYEIWVMGAGLGQTEAGGPAHELRGRIVVE